MKKNTYIFDELGISTQLWHHGRSMLHSHEFYEITYVVQGYTSHLLNGTTDNLAMGDLRILTPTDMHELHDTNEGAHRDILIEKDLFERFCHTVFGKDDFLQRKLSAIHARLDNDQLTELESMMRKFTTETDTEKRRGIGFEAVLKILNVVLSTKTQPEESFENYPPILKQIINNFNKPFSLKTSVSDIIAQTGYNTSYISRLFKKHTGENLSDYLKNLRLKHVAYYLKTTDLSLREIADIVGVESLSYLNSIFKKKYGEPPIQYRKTHRTNNK